MLSAPSPAVYSERRVRFLHRRVAGGIRADVVSEWTRIIDEIDANDDESEDDVVDVGQSGDDGLVTRSKAHFTECIKEGLTHWKELSLRGEGRRRRRRSTTDAGESRVPLDGVAGKDIVDGATRDVQVLPRPPADRRVGWTQRQVNNLMLYIVNSLAASRIIYIMSIRV